MAETNSEQVEAGPTAWADRVPQHSYNRELENGANIFQTHFGSLTDEAWLAVLKRSLTEPVIDGVEFPRFPEDALQSRIHGGSGESSIDEAFNFYRYCRDNTYQTPAAAIGHRLLDFGAGWGRMTRAFMRDFGAAGMYGFEPNLLFCSLARALNPHCCFLHGEQLPSNTLPPAWFDVVIGYSVFSHLPEDSARAWLGEINRSMRPGGWCVLTTWGHRLLDRLLSEAEKHARGEEIHWYHEGLLHNIGDISARIAAFERGEFIFLGEDSALYGDTFLSQQALERILSEEGLDFQLLRFDVTSLPQDAMVLRRPG